MQTANNDNQLIPKRNAVIRTQSVVRSGPIPTPEEMSAYSQVDSTLPDRIMSMAEKEQQNQFDLRKNIIETRDNISIRDYAYDVKALRYCTFLCFAFMVLAAVMFYFEKTGAAIFFCATSFITLPKTYLSPRANKTPKEDQSEKAKND